MQHPLQIRPARMVLEGEEWVQASWADALADALREKQRSRASHGHQFAAINDMWANLPHTHAKAPYAASADAFRKHGLIATGHCDTFCHVFESKADMMALGAVLKAQAEKAHGYALCYYKGNVMTLSTPHSQSYKAMGGERFKQSKQDVLDWACAILGVGDAREVAQ